MCLQPNTNDQGGHAVIDLAAGMAITRGKCMACPLMETVENKVEAMAVAQGMKEIKFTNKKGVTLMHHDWIAGVDHGALDTTDEFGRPTDNEQTEEDAEIEEEPLEEPDQVTAETVVDPAHGELVQDSEEPEAAQEDDNLQGLLDDLIDDSNENILPTGEELLTEAAETEEPGEEESDNPTDVLLRPQRERKQPEVWAHIHSSTTETLSEKNKKDPPLRHHCFRAQFHDMPRMKCTHEEVLTGKMMSEQKHNLFQQSMNDKHKTECCDDEATVAAQFLTESTGKFAFRQHHSSEKGLKKFGEAGVTGTENELGQSHDRACFKPVRVEEMTSEQHRKAQMALAHLTEKKDGKAKVRSACDRARTRECSQDVDASSPAATSEGILLTAMIDACEQHGVMSSDAPDAFIQTPVPADKETAHMKTTGSPAGILVEMHPEEHDEFVVCKKGEPALHVEILRALHGVLQSVPLWHNKFQKDLEEEGFKFNSCDPCVANETVKGSQFTIRFHMDDSMSSHKDPKTNDDFLKFLNKKCREHAEVKAARGARHNCPGVTFQFGDGMVEVDMREHVEAMLAEFPVKFGAGCNAPNPAAADMFGAGAGKCSVAEKKELFHRTTVKVPFLCKRARPDTQPVAAALCARVKQPAENDFSKLVRPMKHLASTENDTLKLSTDEGLNKLEWHIDASFVVHPDFRSHAGAVMMFQGGKGSPIQMSVKQKLNTDSSTAAELAATH